MHRNRTHKFGMRVVGLVLVLLLGLEAKVVMVPLPGKTIVTRASWFEADISPSASVPTNLGTHVIITLVTLATAYSRVAKGKFQSA